ncbi:MAG: T9SS type A sorting domain-containing protein [Candidatus Kryptoniota bacterium]
MKKLNLTAWAFLVAAAQILLFAAEARSQQMPDFTGEVFPPDHALNTPIDSLPVDANSNNYINSIGNNTSIHPDFGTFYEGSPNGFQYNLVGASQVRVPFTFEYASESDAGPYPVPIPPLVEGLNNYLDDSDGDRHLLVIDTSSHKLYETWYTWPPGHSMPDPGVWSSFPPSNPASWWAGSGAVFDLTSDSLRADGATSADAAGLPIFPLLIRYDEVERAMAGDSILHHAIRMTVQASQNSYIWPARHYASNSSNANLAPMGLRFRLKDTVNISNYSSQMRVILRTMKKYGLIVADNGGNWFFQGSHDTRWSDDELGSLKNLTGNDFEAVDISSWMKRPGFNINSAAVPPAGATSVYSSSSKPPQYALYQSYPNPFNPSTVIRYQLSAVSHVTLKIYDVLGREVESLVNERQAAGSHLAIFSADNLPSGVYFYRLAAGGFVSTKKMILLR